MTDKAATALRKDWHDSPRWKGIKRPYKAEDVIRDPEVRRVYLGDMYG